MVRLVLDLKKSLGENASDYYEKAKKIKKKIKGAEEALQQSIQKLKELEKKRDKIEEEEKLYSFTYKKYGGRSKKDYSPK